MTRAPSEAVIEAVERAQTLHGRTLPNIVPHLDPDERDRLTDDLARQCQQCTHDQEKPCP